VGPGREQVVWTEAGQDTLIARNGSSPGSGTATPAAAGGAIN
jgi:hypothetical protein